MTVNVHSTVDRILALTEREGVLREAAREIEHGNTAGDPQLVEEARALIAKANGLRRVRLALMERCGLR